MELQINNAAVESLSLVDAKKMIEKNKELQLFIAKSRYEDRGPVNKAQDDGKNNVLFDWARIFGRWWCKYSFLYVMIKGVK